MLSCWGDDLYGQTQVMPYGVSTMPVTIQGGFSQISIGEQHVCGLDLNGQLTCWGENWAGQRGLAPGDPNAANPVTPNTVLAPGGVSSWLQISSGGFNSCAIGMNGPATSGPARRTS